MVGLIIKEAFSFGLSWLQGKKKKQEAKDERQAEEIRQTGNWESLHAKGSISSWNDEYWTIVFSLPLILCFFPEYVDTVRQGFEAIESTPEWYRWCVITLVGASVGIRNIPKLWRK